MDYGRGAAHRGPQDGLCRLKPLADGHAVAQLGECPFEGVEPCEEIIGRFDAMVPQLYDEEDRVRRYILHRDRTGEFVRLGLLSISFAVVTNMDHPLVHIGQIAKIGAELKTLAKQQALQTEKSTYVKERRKQPA